MDKTDPWYEGLQPNSEPDLAFVPGSAAPVRRNGGHGKLLAAGLGLAVAAAAVLPLAALNQAAQAQDRQDQAAASANLAVAARNASDPYGLRFINSPQVPTGEMTVQANGLAAAAAAPAGEPPLAQEAAAPIPAQIMSRDSVLSLVRQNFPADQVGNAMAVAACESGQQSVQGATNSDGTTDWGLFQINDGGTLQGALAAVGMPAKTTRDAQIAAMNPQINVRLASHLFADRGWSPWVCAYKQQIVAALYTNEPGAMYGKYSVIGVADPSAAEDAAKAAKAAKKAAKAKAKAKADAKAQALAAAKAAAKADKAAKAEKASQHAAAVAAAKEANKIKAPDVPATSAPLPSASASASASSSSAASNAERSE